MFKFPDSNRVHFQCDILVCKDECDQMICDLPSTQNSNETSRGPLAQARAFEPRADALLQPAEDGALMASTSVFVVEPGSPIGKTDFWRQNSNLLIFFPSIFEFFRAKKRRHWNIFGLLLIQNCRDIIIFGAIIQIMIFHWKKSYENLNFNAFFSFFQILQKCIEY